MPRPRVRPEDRQRAAKACLPCKASKKRCDAQQPCSNCVRRRAGSSCVYTDATSARRVDTRHRPQLSFSQSGDSGRPSIDHSIPSAESPQYGTPDDTGEREQTSASETTPTPRRLTGGRLLLNSKGEKGRKGTLVAHNRRQALNVNCSLYRRDSFAVLLASSPPNHQTADGPLAVHRECQSSCYA